MSNDLGAGDDDGGSIVGGRYRLLGRIGGGDAGRVWRGWDEVAEREVAVKEPRLPGEPGDEVYRRAAHRLYREARAAARVEHPGAVVIHDVVAEGEDELPWIVMELVEGESLAEVIGRGALGVAEAARVGGVLLGALRAAHAVGIVHRDVRPANVLLGADGRVVLTDFGIAHGYGDETPAGELEFAAPEWLAGEHAGPESDLWSLGVLLYAAVEGASPFLRPTAEETRAAVLAGETAEPRHAGELAPLLQGLLVTDPGARLDADEVEKVLHALSGSRPEGTAERTGARRVVAREETQETRVEMETPARRRPFPLSLFFG
ncbi:serine/threonine protein kinase [Streptomyces roseirectus]|uniref:non-specific serine/threonine protein kinase n=1 Tax=Streptomyces roseirectus TaxID=2768066 RepID=A0A7H0ID34_9ACTN|nr:serine/threonine-protein kinase [Streptomyces roseirectus]QNP70700.1 serine/threonine protein kinase [Streptomyces roseirectus]